jgi:type IV pilus assembly protein PilB
MRSPRQRTVGANRLACVHRDYTNERRKKPRRVIRALARHRGQAQPERGNERRRSVTKDPRRRLAIVDEDAATRAIVRKTFSDAYEIDELGDEAALLSKLKARPPAVLLLDCQLQTLDAVQVMQQMAKIPELSRTVIIVLAGPVACFDVEQGHRLGAADVIAKPLDPVDLRARIEGELQRQQMVPNGRQRIGTLLVLAGAITRDQLDTCVAKQREHGGRLGAILVREGLLTEIELVQQLAGQMNIGVVDLHEEAPTATAVGLLPRDFIMRHRVLPLRVDETGSLVLAMTDPLDVVSIDEVSLRIGKRVVRVMCTESGFDEAVTIYLSTRGKLKVSDEDEGVAPEAALALDESVIATVDALISDAASMRASDIHIEPCEDLLRVRCRIDGVLHELREYPLSLAPGVISRLKIMGNLDISERRLPQDGRTSFETSAGEEVDLRLASIPSMHGENITIRLLKSSLVIPTLDDLGLNGLGRTRYEASIRIPEGGVIVSGPTGSGKSTTLYATLELINTPDRKVYTVEDPIERKIPGLVQTEMKEAIGLTFARALRALVRADPDVIMVGEVRDLETAKMAADAALTGHLVFTTVHANDASATLYRLIEMGLPRYVVTAAFRCVAAQRLVRRLCTHCRREETLTAKKWEDLGLGAAPAAEIPIWSPVGCGRCFNTGYLGRVGLFEVLTVDDALREIITGGGAVTDMRRAAAEAGVAGIRDDGVAKVLAGTTSYLELVRVTA